MDRRTFIDMVAGSLLVAPLPALAQQTGKVRRVGLLTSGTAFSDAFFVELRERGWIEGQNLLIERRLAGGKAELVPGLAAELVQLKVDVMVTNGAAASVAAKNATTTIPLVTITGDPLRIGLVASLSRPGGNITGLSTVATELSAKRLELLRELVPTATRVGSLSNPANPFRLDRKEYEQAHRSLGMQMIIVVVADATQLERVVAEVRADALIVPGDALFTSKRDQIANLALKHALPTIAEGRAFVSAGCLASYAPNPSAMSRGVAIFVDKILKGAKPGDLPIEQPTKFDIVVNLITAQVLGVTIPTSLRVRADVI